MDKLNQFRNELDIFGLDCSVIYDELNIHYLSDFAFSDGLLVITKTDAYLLTDFRYFEMAVNNANKEFKVLTPENIFDETVNLITSHSCKTVGIEGNFVSKNEYDKLQKALQGIVVSDLGNIIEKMREIKSDEELTFISQAQEITDKAFSHVLSIMNTSMTENDVACEIEYALKKNGADAFAFDTIAVSGKSSALPHGTPKNIKLQKGFLTMDFGAKFKGYCADMTRTVVIGKADTEMKKLYDTVLKAQASALEYIRYGADCGIADKIARDIIDESYKGAFGHSLGHSVGLYIHESPRLSKRNFGTQMQVNNIFTVEPGIYLYGKYGCRIEDLVCVKQDGSVNFTHSTKEIIEIY